MENLFAERLKEARLRANMNMADLAKKTGLTASAISSYEAMDEAKNKAPSLPNAMKLAQALGVSLEWLSGFNTVKATDIFPLEEVAEKVLIALDLLADCHFEIELDKTYNSFLDLGEEEGFAKDETGYFTLESRAVYNYVKKMMSVHEAIKASGIDDETAEKMKKLLREKCVESIAQEIKNNLQKKGTF